MLNLPGNFSNHTQDIFIKWLKKKLYCAVASSKDGAAVAAKDGAVAATKDG